MCGRIMEVITDDEFGPTWFVCSNCHKDVKARVIDNTDYVSVSYMSTDVTDDCYGVVSKVCLVENGETIETSDDFDI